MIKAIFLWQSGSLIGFSVSGHAGYASKGKDIVCAAVSAVTEMSCNSLTEFFRLPVDLNQQDGSISLRLLSPSADGDRLLRSMQAELERISEQYPKHLAVSIQTENSADNPLPINSGGNPS